MTAFSLETNHAVPFFICKPLQAQRVGLHAFSSRLEASNAAPLALPTQSDGEARSGVVANRARFATGLGIKAPDLITLRQEHGNRVLVVTEASDPQRLRETPGDGLITRCQERPMAVITADCFPVVLAAPRVPAIGIVHAGRKGIAAGIVSTAVNLMCQTFAVSPGAMCAAIGPGIGACCYEVDDATAEPFTLPVFPPAIVRPSRHPGHCYLDLQGAIRQQCSDLGVPATQVWHADLCTACHPQWFCSYRRDGPHSGRMLNVVMLRSARSPAAEKISGSYPGDA